MADLLSGEALVVARTLGACDGIANALKSITGYGEVEVARNVAIFCDDSPQRDGGSPSCPECRTDRCGGTGYKSMFWPMVSS